MPISNLSNGLRTGVCTFTNRPTTPYEGQVIYETDTDKVFVWNGSAWVIPNSPAQNPQGLELITTCTATSTGSGGSYVAATASGGITTIGTINTSVTVSSAFSTTYDNYKIVMNTTGSASHSVDIKFGSSITGYYGVLVYAQFSDAAPSMAGRNNAAQMNWVGGCSGASQASTANLDVMNPFASSYTRVCNGTYNDGAAYGTMQGEHRVATSYTSFILTPNAGTLTGGTIRVYGYRNS